MRKLPSPPSTLERTRGGDGRQPRAAECTLKIHCTAKQNHPQSRGKHFENNPDNPLHAKTYFRLVLTPPLFAINRARQHHPRILRILAISFQNKNSTLKTGRVLTHFF